MRPVVRQVIDRDCHVSLSNRAVLRHVISKLRHGWATFRQMPKADRKELLRQRVQTHKENWGLYHFVMSGGHGFTGYQ
jgi:hypothetical protein